MSSKKLSSNAQAFVDAVRNGDSRAVAAWLEQGMDANTHEGSHPVLHLAVFNGHLNVVSQLIAAGADLDAFDSSYATALHAAVYKNYFKIAEALLDAGADINAQRNPGYSSTPLHGAIWQDIRDGGCERVSFLLRRGADAGRRAYIGIGKVTEQGDAVAQALSMPDNKGQALAQLIANWSQMGAGLRTVGSRFQRDKGKFKL